MVKPPRNFPAVRLARPTGLARIERSVPASFSRVIASKESSTANRLNRSWTTNR